MFFLRDVTYLYCSNNERFEHKFLKHNAPMHHVVRNVLKKQQDQFLGVIVKYEYIHVHFRFSDVTDVSCRLFCFSTAYFQASQL